MVIRHDGGAVSQVGGANVTSVADLIKSKRALEGDLSVARLQIQRIADEIKAYDKAGPKDMARALSNIRYILTGEIEG